MDVPEKVQKAFDEIEVAKKDSDTAWDQFEKVRFRYAAVFSILLPLSYITLAVVLVAALGGFGPLIVPEVTFYPAMILIHLLVLASFQKERTVSQALEDWMRAKRRLSENELLYHVRLLEFLTEVQQQRITTLELENTALVNLHNMQNSPESKPN